MSRAIWHQAVVVLAAAVVFFTQLGTPYLWDEDEPKNAECAREMMERGDWVVPTFNYELRTDKPVLVYWLMISAYVLMGVGELAARFGSATLAVGTSLIVYHLGRLLFRPEVGLWAGLIMATSLMFDVAGRAATPDSTFIFFATLAMLAFVWADGRDRRAADDTIAWRPWPYAPMYMAMSMAVLAKGPAGVVLPLGAVLAYLVCDARAADGLRTKCNGDGERDRQGAAAKHRTTRAARLWSVLQRGLHAIVDSLRPARLWRISRRIYLFEGLVLAAALAAPWYVLVGLRTDGAWLTGFLGKHNVGRFVSTMENHRGPIVYYIPAIIVGFFPWSVFLPLALVNLFRRLRARNDDRRGYLMAACWAAVQIGFFSLAATKLPSYVLPAYPALALFTAAFLDRWLAEPQTVNRGMLRWALVSPALVGIGLAVALPIAASRFVPGEQWLALLGAIPFLQTVVALAYSEAGRTRAAVASFAAFSAVFAVALFGVAAVRVSRHHSSPAIMAAARVASDKRIEIATYRHFEPSLVFYARQRLSQHEAAEAAGEFLGRSRENLVLTRDEHLEELMAAVRDAHVVARHPRFLREGEIVVVGRAPRTAERLPRSPSPQ